MSPPGNPADGVARSVLIVDDDAALVEIFSDHFRNWGYEIEVAPDGVQAIKKIVTRNYSLVLCDIVMPNVAGDLFYLAVSRARPELCDRFLFMSGHTHHPKVEAFMRCVNGTILIKPFKAEALKEAIDQLEHLPKQSRATHAELAALLGFEGSTTEFIYRTSGQKPTPQQ